MTELRRSRWEWSIPHKERMEMFLETGFESDLTLLLGPEGKEFKVHKLFLQGGSKVLYTKIKVCEGEGADEGSNKLTLKLEDVQDGDMDTFKMMLKYLYTGDSGATINQALPLLKMATDFEVMELRDQCATLLEGEITVDNVLPLFEEAMKYAHRDLIATTLKFIARFAHRILRSDRFSDLRLECLVEIIQRDELIVQNEMEVFEAVYRWGHAECERKGWDSSENEVIRKVLEKPLKLLRFPLMKQEEFVLHVARKKLLSSDELVEVLLSFHLPPEQRSTPRKYLSKVEGRRLVQGGGCPTTQATGAGHSGGETLLVFIEGYDTLKLKEILLPIQVFPTRLPCGYDHDTRSYTVDIKLHANNVDDQEMSGLLIEPSGNNDFYRIPIDATLEPQVWYKMTITFTGRSFCIGYGNITSCNYGAFADSAQEMTNFEDSQQASVLNQDGQAVAEADFSIRVRRDDNDQMPITSGFIHSLSFDIN